LSDEIVFSLPFGFDRFGNPCGGHFCVTHGKILIFAGGTLSEEYEVSDFTGFECIRQTGSSLIQGFTAEDECICFCGFTQELFPRFAELAKLLEFYLHTGEFITETDADEPSCPNCGMPLEGAKECVYCMGTGRTMFKLIKRLAPYKKYFITAVICTVLSEAVWVLMPYLSRIIIDRYVTPNSGTANVHPEVYSGLIGVTVTIVTLLVTAGIFEFITMKTSFKAALGLGRDLRQEVFERSQMLSMNRVSKRTAGELINRVTNDAAKLEDFITANGKDALVKILQLVIICILLFVMDWRLALMTIIPVPIVFVIVQRLYKKMEVRYTKVWKNMTRHSETLHDILNGIRVVKSYGSEVKEIRRYADCSEEWAKSAVKAEIMWYLTVPVSQFILTIGNFFVLYFGGRMILENALTLGQLIQFTTYVSMLYEPIRWLTEIPKNLADVSVSAGKVFEIIEEQSDVSDAANPIELDIKGDIDFDGVYFGYKAYNPVLKDITCSIKEGEMIGIVGHSGVGKSTLINLILRLYDCTQGQISIDGVNIKDISQKSLRSQVGVVLQETFLFDGSVLENIAYAKPDASFEEVIRAAKVANAHDFIVRLPDGYNTRVGNKGYQLSGGERQRIAIARAILHNPRIIILDEATASLDTQTEKQIQDALGKLTHGRTTIAIAHRLSTLSSADRLIVLDKGRLAEFGTHNELMRKKGVYYRLVMAQRQTTSMKKIAQQT
jgi:ATP-binding cassette subfamily B protein